jgi:hypothetical protein
VTDEAHGKESARRIQAGLTGLAGIVLLIAMVNLIISNVRDDTQAAAMNAMAMNASVGNEAEPLQEPLAELGVTPAKEDSVVPDLKPDPKIHRRMDQSPARNGTQR